MPPEPLPCARKDFLKERKHERSDSIVPVARWRDSSTTSSSSHHPSRDLARWVSTDFRRPLGHGKQGGWHLYAEELGNGYAPPRTSDKMFEDENSRPSMSMSRGDGKYSRNNRESRGSFSQRDWKGQSWDTGNGSPVALGRAHDLNSDQRSVDDVLTYPSHPHSDFVNVWDHLHSKDQHDNKVGSVSGLGVGQRCERESSLGSMDWKPLKWTRSGSLSSRGSGFSHSSSSKSLAGVDSTEVKTELPPKNATPVDSPSGDAATFLTSPIPSEETSSRKKPRLGWGEGLAKYEKKKVEGPDANVNKDGGLVSANSTEAMHSLSSSLADKSPRVMGFGDCASPATPSSVGCSSSSGVEEKSIGKATTIDNDSNLCISPNLGPQNHQEGLSFNLEKLDVSSIANLGSSLNELLQFDETGSVDSSFVRSTAMNKLLVWKGDILKALEMTESEIDLLENEFKMMKSVHGSLCPRPAASSSFSVEGNENPSNEYEAGPSLIARPAPLQIDSGMDAVVEKMPVCNGALQDVHLDAKDEDIDSPGTATSKFVEPLSSVDVDPASVMVKIAECPGAIDELKSKRSMPSSSEEETRVSAGGDGSLLMKSKDGEPLRRGGNLNADGDSILCDKILVTNKESARKASEVFNRLLPRELSYVDVAERTNVPCMQDNPLIREKFVMRKQFLRFKERVLTLKFKAFQHLWKEDVRLLSLRKFRAKSQKKCELTLRTTLGGYQKHRSSIRSRFSSPAGNLSLVPTMEIVNFTSKLLSDSQVKVCRDGLKMPALMLDEKERAVSRFISSNGLVEDPCAVEKERAMINPWTLEEREIFMDKLATFGKDFRKIASFLDHKTTADCVEFYYKNHKSDCFEKTKRKVDLSEQQLRSSATTYLVSSVKKWNREMNAASLDILGAASVMAACADNVIGNRQMSSGRIILGGHHDSRSPRHEDSFMERSSSFDILGSERETVAADVLAGICGSLSSEAMSSSITSSVDPGDGHRDWKCQKVDSAIKRSSTSDVTQNVDDDTCSDESCGEMDPGHWTDEEKSIFIQAFSSYGKDFAMLSRCVRTRSRNQCKVFFSKVRKCLGLDLLRSSSGNVGRPVGDDTNGGGSDMEDACVLETSSSGKLGAKMDEDLPPSVLNVSQDESDPVGTRKLQTDLNRFDEDHGPGLSDHREAVEATVADACRIEDSNLTNQCAENQFELIQAPKSTILLAGPEADRDQATGNLISTAETVSIAPPCLDTVGQTDVAEVSTERCGSEVEGQELLAECNMNEKGDENCDMVCGDKAELMHESNTIRNASHPAGDTSSCSGFSFSSGNQVQSAEKPLVMSFPHNSLAAVNLVSTKPAISQCERTNHDRLSSTFDLHEDKQGHRSVSTGNNHLDNAQGSHAESSQVLGGYRLQITAKKVMNGGMSCRQLSEVQSMSKSDGVAGAHLAQGFNLHKCTTVKPHSLVADLSHNIGQITDHSRSCSRSLSDAEKPSRNGDVKLFGKILTTHENEEKQISYPRQSSKSTPKFTSHHDVDGNPALLKFDHNNLALENVPVRSYGYWDGSRIQTGFSSLPDSAVLLAKYPAAFGGYSASSSTVEQRALQAVVKSNEPNLNGVTVFPPREISGNGGVGDYLYRNHDGSKVQPFTVDMKARQDIFSEMQRRNGFEAMPSLQPPSRGMVGMNVVGRGRIIVGGPCTSVSDPVAAIKRHYAKTEQYGGQNGSIIREDESWRGKVDIGR